MPNIITQQINTKPLICCEIYSNNLNLMDYLPNIFQHRINTDTLFVYTLNLFIIKLILFVGNESYSVFLEIPKVTA